MSYQVLARKWRPRNFSTLVGQEHVVRALTNALDQQRLHHAWLFTGTRGVGKTTLSRILAKCLNCIGPRGDGGITSKPCGVCPPCVEIDAGRFVDYIELDAASNRGVDEMTQLLEQAVYSPANARFKVYMIDEVHMLSNHAFNAMLKTLEEPPEHVKFILATTDPQKVPVTVLSRCLQFNLKQMPVADITRHLAHVLAEEGIAFERGALLPLARAAAGSMRDALSLTDQAIAYSAGQVTEETVRGMLGALDQTYLVRVLDALADGDGPTLMSVVDEIAARSLSFGNALQDLAALLHRIALMQMMPTQSASGEGEADGAMAEDQHLATLAARFASEEVQLYYQIAAMSRRDLYLAPDETTGFSMALLRMLAFRPQEVDAKSSNAVPRAQSTYSSKPASSRPPTVASALAPTAVPTAAPAPTAAHVAAKEDRSRETSTAAKQTDEPRRAEPEFESASNAPLAIDDWLAIVGQLKLTGLTRELVQQAELVAHDHRSITLRVPIKSLLSGPTLDKLKAALGQHFNRPIAVTVEVGAVKGATVAAAKSDERAARQAEAQAIIDADPFVQTLVRDFGASVVPGSVKPV